ncbi:glycosyltransferase, partial [Henriciella sp.]|uniref:glycosyltransferase n=1 Tax=Henriciella sp. TaxID=1968823 RepID=UPI0017D089D6
MKIFLSALSFNPEFGGPARSVPQLGLALAKMGITVGLWAPDGSAKTSPLIPEATELLAFAGTADWAWAQFGSVDVLHDNGLWQPHHRTLSRLSLEYQVPRVVSTRGMLEPWALEQKPTKKRLAWHLYQKRQLQEARLIHATAPSEASQLRKLGLQNDIEIIPNGVDVPIIEDRLSIRNRRGGSFTCLFMSRLHPKKGLPMLLRAWSDVRPRNWNLVIAGPDEGGHRADLEALVIKLNLSGAVSFSGNLGGEKKSEILRTADLFILPT